MVRTNSVSDSTCRGATSDLPTREMSLHTINELAATFDLVLGKTLEELEDGTLGGGVAISEIQRRRR
jgi:hypothetical protein